MSNQSAASEQFSAFFYGVFLPAIMTFVIGWAVFRLVLNQSLRELGLPPMVPQSGGGAIAVGYGRFSLLIGLSVVVTIPCYLVYVRLFGAPSRDFTLDE